MKTINFDFKESEKGIERFDVSVTAKDQAAATSKLVSYLNELRWNFVRPSISLTCKSSAGEVGNAVLSRLNSLADPIAFVITLHLFTEHWLNRWIRHLFSKKDLSRYTYARKLELISAHGDLPEDLDHNLRKLNALRNDVAHEMDFDFTKMKLDYRGCSKDFNLSKYRPSLKPDSKQHHVSNVLYGLFTVTYMPLHNHSSKFLSREKAALTS